MEGGSYRPTWAEIDLGAVRYNLGAVRTMLDSDVKVMAVVKANAYGHGIERVGRELIAGGVDYLGVATVDEALILRGMDAEIPILVLGSVLTEEARAAVDNNITLTLCNRALLNTLSNIVVNSDLIPKVHIKVDTGMGRLGVWHEEALEFITEVKARGNMEIEGVYTHFSSAGRDKTATRTQIRDFEKVINDMESRGIDVRYRHASNSIAVVDWKSAHLNLVRPGILFYGVYPKRGFSRDLELKPVMSLKTRIVHLKDTPAGRSISYGRTYITQKDTRIATIPIGYADGYGRILSNKARALVRGRFVRVAGIVTMDQTLLDVGHVKGVSIGDEVVLIGQQGRSEISIERIAKLAGTIPYEILSQITDRVPRIYKN
jgi:alanine racemase